MNDDEMPQSVGNVPPATGPRPSQQGTNEPGSLERIAAAVEDIRDMLQHHLETDHDDEEGDEEELKAYMVLPAPGAPRGTAYAAKSDLHAKNLYWRDGQPEAHSYSDLTAIYEPTDKDLTEGEIPPLKGLEIGVYGMVEHEQCPSCERNAGRVYHNDNHGFYCNKCHGDVGPNKHEKPKRGHES